MTVMTLWGETDELPAHPRAGTKPRPAQVVDVSPVSVPDERVYPLATYNKILEILARLYPQFIDEVIAAGIGASTAEQAKEIAHFADLWQRRLAKVRELAGKKEKVS